MNRVRKRRLFQPSSSTLLEEDEGEVGFIYFLGVSKIESNAFSATVRGGKGKCATLRADD